MTSQDLKDLIDYDHDKFLEFYKLGDSNVKD